MRARTAAPSALAAALVLACSTSSGQTPTDTVRISGTVLDSNGGPARYEAIHLRLPGKQDFLTTVPADSNGKFVFVVQPKTYELVVDLPSSPVLVQPVDASDGRDVDAGLLKVRFASLCDQTPVITAAPTPQRNPPKYPMSGRVVDAGGKAVANAIVVFVDSCNASETETGPDGRFRVRLLWSFGYVLEVKGPGFLPVVRNGVETGHRFKNRDLGTITVGQSDRRDPPGRRRKCMP
jgi:hypothetical protein